MSDITNKIRKLFALAHDKGATEAEAARAMELATRLMLEHGVSRETLEDTEDRVGHGEWGDLEGDDDWRWFCVHAATTLYGTRVVSSTNKTQLYFVGRKDNIAATEMTLAWLLDQVEFLYKAALPRGMSKRDRADYRRNFKRACALRVYSRACEIVRNLQDKGTEQSTALVVQDYRKTLDAEADDFIQNKLGLGEGKKGRAIKLNVSSRGTWEGYAAGGKVQLQKEVK